MNVKLGDVLKKERNRKHLSSDDVASRMHLSADDYNDLETGESPFETSGRLLGQIAIELETPLSRLISKTGKSAQASQEDGQCGKLIQCQRTRRELTLDQLAGRLQISVVELATIENGASEIEKHAPLLLRFAEIIDQPVFNLLYPCGLSVDKLEDYP